MKVPIKEQILFARNISLMSRSGIPILQSLHLVAQQTASPGMRKVLTVLITDVENGQFLSTSLKKFESVFGSLFINIVRIGETSGTLSENLGFLADELKKKNELRGKILSAMMYPIIIVITTILLMAILTFAVFPKILPIFESFQVPLPLTTRIVIGSNKIMLAYWPYILIGILVVVGLWFLLIRLPRFRFLFQMFLIRLPIIGPLTMSIQMAIIARTMALLLKSGVKIVEALLITGDIVPNLVYRQLIAAAGEQVKAGSPLGRYFANYPQYVPLMFSQMLDVSETAGTMDATLLYLSDYYEAEVDETTRNFVSLLEPLLMLTMGGAVGFIAISIILPIYSISQNFG
ncbi:MAG TPA: type II secretion system F family protein [Patescibacteria group bacterium]